jgi:hypothetical protein
MTNCVVLSSQTRGGLALVVCQMAFRISMLLSPWAWVTAQPSVPAIWADIQAHLDSADGRPIFLLGNHTSFLDTLLTVAKAPMQIIYRSRTYAASYLLQMPILGVPTSAQRTVYKYAQVSILTALLATLSHILENVHNKTSSIDDVV